MAVTAAAERGEQPATISASSIVGAGVSASHRSSHRAASLRDRGRSFNAVRAVSSSASARSSRPSSSAVTSATTRLPRSIAFLKIAVGVPWFPVHASPGPDGSQSLRSRGDAAPRAARRGQWREGTNGFAVARRTAGRLLDN